MRIRTIPIWITNIIVLIASSGCSSEPKMTPRPPKPPSISVLRNIHHVGGTHYRMAVQGGVWYQTFGGSLRVIDSSTAVELKAIPLGEDGDIGPATDLAISGKRMYLVIEDDEVIEFSMAVPQMPAIKERLSAEMLGIRPRRLSVVDGECYASGPGGIVRLSDRALLMNSRDDPGRVANSAQGLVTTIGRQVRLLADDKYVGSATDLQMLPGDINAAPEATIVFARQSEKGALVGLMSPEIREVDSKKTTVAVQGFVRQVRVAAGQLWVVTDTQVSSYKVSSDSLELNAQINVLGALDAAPLRENYVAVAGVFGRTIYRIKQDEKGPGDAFVGSHREAAGLTRAVSDDQHILAGSDLGLWMYLVNSRAELTTRSFENVPSGPSRQAATVNAQAKIATDGKSVQISSAGGSSDYAEPDERLFTCIAAIDGDLWLGHTRGITVLCTDPEIIVQATATTTTAGDAKAAADPAMAIPTFIVVGQLRLEGPVNYLYPLMVGGGASYVSEFGGFGVAKFVDEPIKP